MATVRHLYMEYTNDTHSRKWTIDAEFAKLDPRRQRMVLARVKGDTFKAITAQDDPGCTLAMAFYTLGTPWNGFGKSRTANCRAHVFREVCRT